MVAAPKVLFLALETLPDMDSAFERWTTLSSWYDVTFGADLQSIICFGYKWEHEKNAKILCAWDYAGWKTSINDDKPICKALYEIIKEADVVVTQNGVKFDWPFIETRLLLNRLPPLPKGIIHVDTKVEARKLKLSSRSLKNMAKLFTDEVKDESGGWDLWVAVRKKSPKAMKKMASYCKQDVIALEAIYKRLKPLMKKLPNMNMFSLEKDRCPNCGSLSIQRRGRNVKGNAIFQRFQCMDCGAWANRALELLTPKAG
jgi:hypothetical protein